jgi:hypothetical protein
MSELDQLIQLQKENKALKAKLKWTSVEDGLPVGKNVLAYYKNSSNKGRIVKASYVARFTEESTERDWCDPYDEYCEEKDMYFLKEGWYELCENGNDEYNSWFIHEGTVTHWMPLPDSPKETIGE